MGGLCMGYARRELEARLDWIIAFSELGRVIDQPLRTYSSGMKSRLMYAVAFCMAVEIMIVDEALATGDGAFVRKCTQHIVDLCNHGTTALVVSHNLYFLERLCDRVLYLRDGRLLADGDPLAVCKLYEADLGRDFVAASSGELAGSASALPGGATGGLPARESAGDSGHATGNAHVYLRAEDDVADPRGVAHPRGVADPRGIADPRGEPDPAASVAFACEAEPLGPEAGTSGRNGPGEICGADGRWMPFDFSGAPAVRHLELVRLREAMLLDEHGRRTHEIVTGRPARLRFVIESRVRKRDVHIGFMLWNDRDVHVATTTNICSLDEEGRSNGVRLHLTEGVFAVEAAFPSLRLGAGRYWLRFGIGPGYEHYSPDDQLLSENRCLAFAVLRPDHVQDVLHEPVSRWSGLQRLAAPQPVASVRQPAG
jgi:hypothetical protein